MTSAWCLLWIYSQYLNFDSSLDFICSHWLFIQLIWSFIDQISCSLTSLRSYLLICSFIYITFSYLSLTYSIKIALASLFFCKLWISLSSSLSWDTSKSSIQSNSFSKVFILNGDLVGDRDFYHRCCEFIFRIYTFTLSFFYWKALGEFSMSSAPDENSESLVTLKFRR